MISLLCPTRGRYAGFCRMVDSIILNSGGFAVHGDPAPVEIIAYQDEDDEKYPHTHSKELVKIIRGPRITLSDAWNKCAEHAKGDLLMMIADDAIMRTFGWNFDFEEALLRAPKDRICLLYSDDGVTKHNMSVFPCITRQWYEAIGRFCPPYFVGDYPDQWLWDVIGMVDPHRRIYIPDVLIEHLHPIHRKAQDDATYRERREREQKEPPSQLYAKYAEERRREAEILKNRIALCAVAS